jgi:hypothetical protein
VEERAQALRAQADKFTWRKKTFFGGVYQCVVVEHKGRIATRKLPCYAASSKC